MIVCDICRQEIKGMRFTLNASVVGGGGAPPPRQLELVHACSPDHFAIAIARCSREHVEALKLTQAVLEQARAELAR